MSRGPVDVYYRQPWLKMYPQGVPATLIQEFSDALRIFKSAVLHAPSAPALQYFDQAMSYGQLDHLSDSLASWLLQQGAQRGDRVALILQNVPQFLIALLGIWKLGAIAVPMNPMNRERELVLLMKDCSPTLIICHPAGEEIARAALSGAALDSSARVVSTTASHFQSRNDRRVLPDERSTAQDLVQQIAAYAGETPPAINLSSQETAVILYTSGTTGVPKGAMLTHGNICFSGQVFRDWVGLAGAGVLGIAPLFHVTGLVGHIVLSMLTRAPLILGYRFDAAVMRDLIAQHRPEFTIGAITAFVALMNTDDEASGDLSSFRSIFSGGAPIAPSMVAQFQARFGHYIHNSYGLTESTSPAILVPREQRAPVDANSGALSIGVPVFDTHVRIADENGESVACTEFGEILVRGPQVMSGYWNKPEETQATIKEGWLYTGDIGFMDRHGWFYLVDRKKDMINASGFKVWPREVEEVLYTHPAVREAAVVGVEDAYRGETVKAVVSLKSESSATPAELSEFCRGLLAAYKQPRIIEIVDDLPKTASGKILRRELRTR